MQDTNTNLIKQLEFYLSDGNLQHDEFFYKEVAANKDHFVKIDKFLNCNKIKKMGVSKPQQIVAAIQKSDNFQLNQSKTMLRRKSLDQLPEFQPKKKTKTEDVNQQENPYQHIDPVIFTLSIQKQQNVPFRYIQEALLKNHNVYSPYTRFSKKEGHFAVDKKSCTQEIISKLEKEGLKIGEAQLIIKKAQKDALSEFWEKHGHHYNGIIDQLKKEANKKAKEQKLKEKKNIKLKEFQFGGQKYNQINKLKSLFKNILCRNPNNKPLAEGQARLVTELLGYHHNGGEKLKNYKHFVVDVHPEYVDTRCLFVVKQDGTRQDFSILKCIKNIQEKFAL